MSEFDPYIYWCKPTRIVDGDSLYVTIDWGCRNYTEKVECRLYGIDTPELTRKTSWLDDQTFAKQLAKTAKEFLAIATLDEWMPMKTFKDSTGSFSRLLIALYPPEDKIVQAMTVVRGNWPGLFEIQDLPLWGADRRTYEMPVINARGSINVSMWERGFARPNYYDATSKKLREQDPPLRGV